jgi:hypothetical protein
VARARICARKSRKTGDWRCQRHLNRGRGVRPRLARRRRDRDCARGRHRQHLLRLPAVRHGERGAQRRPPLLWLRAHLPPAAISSEVNLRIEESSGQRRSAGEGGRLGWHRHGSLGSGSSRRSPWSRLPASAPPAAGSGHRPSGRPSRVAAPWPRATVHRGQEPPCAVFAGSRATGPRATAQAGGRGCSKPRGDEIGGKGRERIESGGENKRLY